MRGLLSFLHVAYFPFIGFLGFLQFALAGFFLAAGILGGSGLYVFLAILFFVFFCLFLLPMYHFFTWQPESGWIMELKVSREEVPEIYEMADEVAERCRFPRPDEIRLSPTTEAAAYQTKGGRQVLKLGALTIAAFPPSAVKAIIAHELAHMGLGDTAMLREMYMTHMVMAFTRHHLLYQAWISPWIVSLYDALDGVLGRRLMAIVRLLLLTFASVRFILRRFHPFLWAAFLYQWVFDIAFAAVSRDQEYDADEAAVAQSGPEDIAAALFYLHVTPLIPKTSFNDLLLAIARTRDFEKRAFTAQVHEVRSASKGAWKKAMKKALNQGTRVFDDHPSLADRLTAIGVEPDEAFAWAREMEGEPTSFQIEKWLELERKLTIRLLAPYLHLIESKMNFGSLVAKVG